MRTPSFFSNVRQRTDPIDAFTTETSCLTIVWAVMQDIRAAYDSGQLVLSQTDGLVVSATGREIVVVDDEGSGREFRYPLRKCGQPLGTAGEIHGHQNHDYPGDH